MTLKDLNCHSFGSYQEAHVTELQFDLLGEGVFLLLLTLQKLEAIDRLMSYE